MSKDKQVSGTVSEDKKIINELSLQILIEEYDTLKDLYSQAESSAQNIFNFYLALVTTVIGGVVVVFQVAPPSTDGLLRSRLIVSGLVLFAAIIGSMYSTALSWRYASIMRFAQGMDEIRRYLINQLDIPLPTVYKLFLEGDKSRRQPRSFLSIIEWILPTGTYHFFIATINSTALAVAIWLLLDIGGITQSDFVRSIVTAIAVLIFSYLTYIIHSRLTIRNVVTRLTVQVYIPRA